MSSVCLRIKNEDGSFREFRKDSVKARWVKEGYKHQKRLVELTKTDAEKALDERIRFTCDFFGDKELTPDVILDGLENDELIDTLDDIFGKILGVKDEPQGNQ